MTLMGYSIAMMILSPPRVKAVLIGTCFTELRKRLVDQATFVPLLQMLHELQVLQKQHRFQNGVSPYHHRRHRDQHPRRKLKLKVPQVLQFLALRATQVNQTKVGNRRAKVLIEVMRQASALVQPRCRLWQGLKLKSEQPWRLQKPLEDLMLDVKR